MEAGEKELRMAFEDVTTNNVKAVVEHSNETRQLVRDVEKKINKLFEQREQDKLVLDEMRLLIVNLQTKVYSGGT